MDPVATGLSPQEPLARFLCSSSWFVRLSARVKYSAFMPFHGATSVFRISALRDPEVWEIGERLVAGPTGRHLHGHAALRVTHVVRAELMLAPDDRPPRHANIVGWPAEKGAQRFLAEQLAGEAELRLRQD
jgi:hypothetical protein